MSDSSNGALRKFALLIVAKVVVIAGVIILVVQLV